MISFLCKEFYPLCTKTRATINIKYKVPYGFRSIIWILFFLFLESELNIHQPVPASPTAVSRKQSTAGSNRNKIQNINTRYKSTHLRAQDSNNSIPSFENNLISNVTAQEGSIAVLPCHVRNLGDRPVSINITLCNH